MAEQPIFEIGFVMAGAVSAGAYSAGVMDFIIEALDEYEAAKKSPDWTGPRHSVRVPVMAGASAGGMTAAIAALQAHALMTHMWPGTILQNPEENRLYASWVDEIDIFGLLETRDIGGPGTLRSALSSAVLEDILKRTIALPATERRAWLGREESNALAVLLTISNLGGVPYAFDVAGARGGFGMLNHGDDLRFLVGRSPQPRPETAAFDRLDLDAPDDLVRGRFGAAALATGAFPIGLAARPIERPHADYQRDDRVGFDQVLPNGDLRFKGRRPIPPTDPDPLRLIAVDGGVIDNEPFELARRFLCDRVAKQLAGARNLENENGVSTQYATILVDPFPNVAAWPKDRNASDLLAPVAMRLVGMLVDQARFKPQELTLALDESVRSRFAILPDRGDAASGPDVLQIACGALGGFSGFLHRSFRHHDYCLGRRNAQAFLRYHFSLPETNPMFGAWKASGADPTPWYVENPPDKQAAGPLQTKPTVAIASSAAPAKHERTLPIIPLTERLKTEIVIGPGDRPCADARTSAALKDALSNRLALVVARLVDDHLSSFIPFGPVGRFALKRVAPGVLVNKAVTMIDDALAQIERSFPA